MPSEKEEPKGAFDQIVQAQQPQGSKLNAISKNFYGDEPSLGQSMGEVVKSLMPSRADTQRSADMAFWSGFGAPNSSGQMSGQLGNAMKAQTERELEGEKLKASYVPAITQAMLANQTQTLAANKAATDLAERAAPEFYKAAAASGANGNKPSSLDMYRRYKQVGNTLGVPSYITQSHIDTIPTDENQIENYMAQRAAMLNPSTMGQNFRENAAGVTTVGAPASGNVRSANGNTQQNQQSVAPNANPSAATAEFAKGAIGDPKEYGNTLQEQAKSSADMVKRFNEMHELAKEFTPGRLAGRAGDIAGIVKDVAARLPGIDQNKIKDLTGVILNAKNPGEALAAQQFLEQLMVQQVPAEIRGALGSGNRISIPEYKSFNAANLGTKLDPETLNKMEKFYGDFADRNVNRLVKWNSYLNDSTNPNRSVSDFTAKDTKEYLDSLRKVRAENDKAAPVVKEEKTVISAPVAVSEKAAPVDLKNYEPGAKLSASGKAYVIDANGRHVYAKPIK